MKQRKSAWSDKYVSRTHEQYNHYTHRPDYVTEIRRRSRSTIMLFLLGLMLGGMIGFGIGISWPASERRQSIEQKVITEHRIIYDHKTVIDKPPVTCKAIYDVGGDLAPYVVIQCSDGRMKVIRG